MPLPPLNRLRRDVAFLVCIFFCFALYRLFFFETKVDLSLPEKAPSIYTEMCLLVASGIPMNIDTVFNLGSNVNRIFAYSFLTTDFNVSDTIWHIWYYGSDIVKKTVCVVENAACFSSIFADSLQKGHWSVDTRQGNALLNVKQFRIEKK